MKNNYFNIFYILIFSILLAVFVYFANAIFPALIGKTLVLCGSCLNYLWPLIQKSYIFLLLFAVASAIITIFKTIYFQKRLRIINNSFLDIQKIEKKCAVEGKIKIFSHNNPIAFCLGIINPKIYLADRLIEIMTPLEIETIILHEKQHLNHNDNYCLLLAQILKNAFFFLPIVGELINWIRIQKEIAVDRMVIQELGNNNSVLSALRKVLEFPPIRTVPVNAFSQMDNIDVRIKSLLGIKHGKYPISFSSTIITLSVFLLAANIIMSKIEVHQQLKQEASVCFDKGNCDNVCQ